jgi:hypothetical protein
MVKVATEKDKQIAKEIIIAYIQYGGAGTIFKPGISDVEPFEKIWSRILKTVSAETVE